VGTYTSDQIFVREYDHTFFDQTYFSFAKTKRVYEPKFRSRPKTNVRGNKNFVRNGIPKKEQTKIMFRAAFRNESKPKKGLKSSFDKTNGICVQSFQTIPQTKLRFQRPFGAALKRVFRSRSRSKHSFKHN